MKYFATPPVHGALARYVDHPAYQAFKLPDNMSYEEGAMVEPLSNGMQACRRGEIKPGKTVAILGAGPMGKPFLSAVHILAGAQQALGLQACSAAFFVASQISGA